MQITTKDINTLKQLRNLLQAGLADLNEFLERAEENETQPRKRANLNEARKEKYTQYFITRKKRA